MSKVISKYILIIAIIVIIIPYLSLGENVKQVILTLTGMFAFYVYFKVRPKKPSNHENEFYKESAPEEGQTGWQDIRQI